ncbi:polysaccharide biosynthesis tyrosine autokinase [Burkholderia pyrrocinia]|uniref:polysaccharide biosynthesis tyrosine autokinase n=1 Tax=Burkholderia pyrrocinia TaxID=60550 RepID=UPI001FC8D537|nr:polysaccharide biosynthesis tyrosine autokinase [Burkholderia pyrrocinia]
MNIPNINDRDFGGLPEDMPNARGMIRLLGDHLWTVAGITLAVVMLAGAYVWLVSPVYSSSAVIRVDAQDRNALGFAPEGQLVLGQKPPRTDAEIGMMQSRTVLDPVLSHYGYDITVKPRVVPLFGAIARKFATPGEPSRPWFGLDSYAWGGERVDIDSLHVPPRLENKTLRLRTLDNGAFELIDTRGYVMLSGKVGEQVQADGVSILVKRLDARPHTEFDVVAWNGVNALQRFSSNLKILEKGRETGIVQITFDSNDPEVSANVANAIAQGYVAATITERRANDSKTLDFINNELPRLREELRQAEATLMGYEASVGSLRPTAEAQSYLQGGIDIERQIAMLQLQRTQMLQNFTPGSAPMRNIDQQLAQLNAAKAQFDSRFVRMPASERTNADLSRNAKVAEAIYITMVNKAEELTVRRAGTTGDVHIVDSAIRPADPVSPAIPIVMAASVGVGLMLGSLFVFARSRYMTGVTDSKFIERSMRLPILGSILYSAEQVRLGHTMPRRLPYKSTEEEGHRQPSLLLSSTRPGGPPIEEIALPATSQYLLARRFPHDTTVEALRGVRTALHLNETSRSDDGVVVLTGPTPGTGKSFIAANLAVLEAETTRRVLLVDADMRCGSLASFFSKPNTGGLAELLAGNLNIDQAIQTAGIPGLSLLSCGRYPRNPSELLMMPGFKTLLAELKRRFDLVIIDTPPLLAVSDAAIVANGANKTVLVLRSGTQTEEEIEETITKLERAGAWIAGAIFNAVPLRRSERRNYGYTSAYLNHNQMVV